MRINSSNFSLFWRRHPVANPVISLLVSGYALFVVICTAAHGLAALDTALASVPELVRTKLAV